MRFIRYTLMTALMVAGLALAASAQKDGDKKQTPPKNPPPVVTPEKKPPPTPKPGVAMVDMKDNEQFA